MIDTESVTIVVGENTHVEGALIANINEEGEDAGNLRLETETLTFTNIENEQFSEEVRKKRLV